MLAVVNHAAAGPHTRLVVFAPGTDSLGAARRRLPFAVATLCASSWPIALRMTHETESCLLVWVPQGSAFNAVAALETARPGLADTAIVLAHADAATRDTARALGLILEAIPLAATASQLWSATQAACTAALLARAAERVRALPLHAGLRDALTLLFTAERPPRTLEELSAAVGVHRRTLWLHWRRRVPEARLRLEDVVTWGMLLRAGILRCRGVSWRAAATDLGVHRHTLARAARRRGLHRLPDVAIGEWPCAFERLRAGFRQNVLRALAGDQRQVARQAAERSITNRDRPTEAEG